jgi:polyphenol oxidase
MVTAHRFRIIKGIHHGFYTAFESRNMQHDASFIHEALMLKQIHGKRVVAAEDAVSGKTEADGCISGGYHLLTVQTADCLPILLSSVLGDCVAVVHAGWRGLADGVIQTAIDIFLKRGVDIKNLMIAIGPHICKKCYTTTWDRVELLQRSVSKQSWYSKGEKETYNVDLDKLTNLQLIKAGIQPDKIESVGICTKCNPSYYSFRRDGNSAGRQFSFIQRIG